MSKAKVISVLNHKGGVGKTTTTINLGGALRQKGYKVLLIDLDGQANLTESLGFSAELPQTIYGAMKGEYDLPIYEHKDGLSVVPSCLDLSAVETELINEAGQKEAQKPKKAKTVHCNFVMDETYHQNLKLIAIRKGDSLKSVLQEAISDYLDKNSSLL